MSVKGRFYRLALTDFILDIQVEIFKKQVCTVILHLIATTKSKTNILNKERERFKPGKCDIFSGERESETIEHCNLT